MVEKLSRAEQTKRNYNMLREAGYTSAEARELRCKGAEAIKAAIAAKTGQPTPEDVIQTAHNGPEIEQEASKQPQRGNSPRRVSAEEITLLERLREAGITPAEVEAIVKDRLVEWVAQWEKMESKKVPGAGIMADKLRGQVGVFADAE